ncbi:MAG: sigma-70 family RNA polymerase sigma factor, partial [Patescibacteria group bacterium]
MKKHLKNPPRREEETEPTAEELHELEKEIVEDEDKRLDGPFALGERWLARLTRHPILSHEETLVLARRAQGNPPDLAARDRLIRCNMKLVVGIANRRIQWQRHLSLDDLIQEGTLGLIRAIERFDPSLGFHLSTYAIWWIRQAMTRAIADRDREVRLPVHMHEGLSRLHKVDVGLTEEEAAQETGLLVGRVRALRLASTLRRVSLDASAGEDDDRTLYDILPAETAPPDYNLDRMDLIRFLAALPARERTVMLLRLALTLKAVGKHLDLTRDRIRQLEKEAMAQMRTDRY